MVVVFLMVGKGLYARFHSVAAGETGADSPNVSNFGVSIPGTINPR